MKKLKWAYGICLTLFLLLFGYVSCDQQLSPFSKQPPKAGVHHDPL